MPREVGAAVMACPYRQCGVNVRVLRADTRATVDGAEVELVETGERRTLGPVGVVSFEHLAAGSYTARVRSATIAGEIPVGLPQSSAVRVEGGALATIEVLVHLQDWEITTVVVSGGEVSDGERSADPPPAEDWEITTVVVSGGDEGDEGGDAPAGVTETDWQLTTIEIHGSASSDGDDGDVPTAPPPGATWRLDAIAVVDDERD